MDYILALKYLNIFLTTFFTFLLALFAFFQWRAVEKQNDQNLFKLRMEHFNKIKTMQVDFIKLTDYKKDLVTIHSSKKKLVNDLVANLLVIVQESGLLFNKDVYDHEKLILSEYSKIRLELERSVRLMSINIDLSFEAISQAEEKLNDIFLKFLKLGNNQ